MAGLGWQELVIVLVIVVIIFGAGRLPEIGGALGKSIKEFKSQSGEPEGQITEGTSTRIDPPRATTTDRREVRADEI